MEKLIIFMMAKQFSDGKQIMPAVLPTQWVRLSLWLPVELRSWFPAHREQSSLVWLGNGSGAPSSQSLSLLSAPCAPSTLTFHWFSSEHPTSSIARVGPVVMSPSEIAGKDIRTVTYRYLPLMFDKARQVTLKFLTLVIEGSSGRSTGNMELISSRVMGAHCCASTGTTKRASRE